MIGCQGEWNQIVRAAGWGSSRGLESKPGDLLKPLVIWHVSSSTEVAPLHGRQIGRSQHISTGGRAFRGPSRSRKVPKHGDFLEKLSDI